jgi:hypothetical protein
MGAAPTREADSQMIDATAVIDVAMHQADGENRARDAGPELLKTLKALFAVVGARHLTPDTLHTYLRAKDLIERMEGGGA